MSLFVDTSGLIALLDRDDPAHAAVVAASEGVGTDTLITHAYVVVETLAVVRRRFGAVATADVTDRVLPAIAVTLVDGELNDAAVSAFRAAIESSVSLVDRTSFAFMRREGIRAGDRARRGLPHRWVPDHPLKAPPDCWANRPAERGSWTPRRLRRHSSPATRQTDP